MINLGAAFLEQGDYAQAELHYQKSLTINEKILGTNHSEIAKSLVGMGELSLAQGKLAQAKTHFNRVTDICAKTTCSEGSYCVALFVLEKIKKKNSPTSLRLGELGRKAKQECPKTPFLKEKLDRISQWLDKHNR